MTIAVAATYEPEAFDPETGEPAPNIAAPLFRAIAAVVAPDAYTPGG